MHHTWLARACKLYELHLLFRRNRACRRDNLERYEQGCSRRPVSTSAEAHPTDTYYLLHTSLLRLSSCETRHVPTFTACSTPKVLESTTNATRNLTPRALCPLVCYRCESLRYPLVSHYFRAGFGMRVQVRVGATSLPVNAARYLEFEHTAHSLATRHKAKGGVAIHRDKCPACRYR